MDNNFLLVVGIGAITSFLTYLGVVVAERTQVSKYMVSRAFQFAAGVLTALVAFSLMAPAVQLGPAVGVILGFFVGGASFVVMDYRISQRQAARSAELTDASTTLYIGIVVDMLIDGAVIGIGSSLTLATGLVLAISIAISTAPLAMVTTAMAKEKGQSDRFRRILSLVFVAAIMGGTLLGFFIFRNQSLDVRLILIAVASGFLITTVTQSIIPEANRDGEPSLSALFFVSGLSLYALFTFFAT